MRKKGLFFIWLSFTFPLKAQERGLTINEPRLPGKWKYIPITNIPITNTPITNH